MQVLSDNGGVSGDAAYPGLHLEHTSTVDRVAEELRRAVFDGELTAGTPLREVALADSLGVSRSTVREAFGTLVAEGIATRSPHRGVTVSVPDPDSVRDICRARAVLETAGVRRWPTASDAARDSVRTALFAYAEAVGDGAPYQVLNDRHLALHLSLVALLDSPRLLATAHSLGDELRLALAQIDRVRRNTHAQADTHGHLLRLLDDGDLDAAEAEIARHLADAEVDILFALALPAG